MDERNPTNKFSIPLFISAVHAGFPSPADDFIENVLDLDELLIKHPQATFMVRVAGDSMIRKGYFPGDILIVDKSLAPVQHSPVIAMCNGEFTFKSYYKQSNGIYLLPANPKYKPIKVTEGSDFQVWGVVTASYPAMTSVTHRWHIHAAPVSWIQAA